MKFVPNAVSTRVARQLLVTQKHSPQLLVAAGIVGLGATVVLACRATLEVDQILDNAQQDLKKINEVSTSPSFTGKYSEHDATKDRAIVYARTSFALVKLYSPAIVCGALTVSAFVGSNHILSKRNAALAAAYGSLKESFDRYRDRVRREHGEEYERDVYMGLEKCEIDDEETGKKVKAKRVGPDGPLSPYAKLFDEFNINWEPIPEHNTLFLKLQQNAANDRLHATGHLFLNDVYRSIGLPDTPEGAVVGWIDGQGDSYVDFGIFRDDLSERILDFMNGREKSIWLDFNVDGLIYKKI